MCEFHHPTEHAYPNEANYQRFFIEVQPIQICTAKELMIDHEEIMMGAYLRSE